MTESEGSIPINILRVISRLNTGGPAVHTVLLTEGLNGGQFRSRLVTGVVSPREGDMTYYAEQRGVIPIVVPELGRNIAPVNDFTALWKLYRLLRRERPDILHTHTAKAGGLGRLAGILYNSVCLFSNRTRVKLVHSFHGHIFHGYFAPWKSRLLVLTERVLALFTHKIITISDGLKRELVETYRICPADRVAVVPLGLDFGWTGDMALWAGTLRRAFDLPHDVVTIGIVGRLTMVKNHRLFLEAARRLADQDVRCIIVGDGEMAAEIRATTSALGLDGRVLSAGWQRETAKIYADLDIVCLTSRNEGTPVALIEAMAAGRPFVATSVGGVRDLMVGAGKPHPAGFEEFDNGILVPPDDPTVLAAALDYLAAHPELRAAMGQTGRATALERFSKDRLLRDVAGIYQAILTPADGTPCAR